MTKLNEPLRRALAHIPAWAFALAAVVFVGAVGGLLWLFETQERNPPPFLFQVIFSAYIGFFLALPALGLGYVNRDARRRRMSAALWTLLVAVPSPLFIIYFLLRSPMPVPCTACGAFARAGSRFCPSCGRTFGTICATCGQPLAEADAYCSGCGRALRKGAGSPEAREP